MTTTQAVSTTKDAPTGDMPARLPTTRQAMPSLHVGHDVSVDGALLAMLQSEQSDSQYLPSEGPVIPTTVPTAPASSRTIALDPLKKNRGTLAPLLSSMHLTPSVKQSLILCGMTVNSPAIRLKTLDDALSQFSRIRDFRTTAQSMGLWSKFPPLLNEMAKLKKELSQTIKSLESSVGRLMNQANSLLGKAAPLSPKQLLFFNQLPGHLLTAHHQITRVTQVLYPLSVSVTEVHPLCPEISRFCRELPLLLTTAPLEVETPAVVAQHVLEKKATQVALDLIEWGAARRKLQASQDLVGARVSDKAAVLQSLVQTEDALCQSLSQPAMIDFLTRLIASDLGSAAPLTSQDERLLQILTRMLMNAFPDCLGDEVDVVLTDKPNATLVALLVALALYAESLSGRNPTLSRLLAAFSAWAEQRFGMKTKELIAILEDRTRRSEGGRLNSIMQYALAKLRQLRTSPHSESAVSA